MTAINKNKNVLVYLDIYSSHPDVHCITYIAKIISQNDDDTYDVILLTDELGNTVENINPVTISHDVIVSYRPVHDIQPKFFYYFSELQSETINADRFVMKQYDDYKQILLPTLSLTQTTRIPFGSGIYGKYVANDNNLDDLTIDENEQIYRIDANDCYLIQDQAHGDSVILASLHTNRYLDDVFLSIQAQPNKETMDVDSLIIDAENLNIKAPNIKISSLITLWNIALARTNDNISENQFLQILHNYVVDFLTQTTLRDAITNEFLSPLPINYILNDLGYHGILASDSTNNGWDRGCVSYDLELVQDLRGGIERY